MHPSRFVQLFRATAPQVIDSSAQCASATPCPRRGFAFAAFLLAAFLTILSMPVFAQTTATISGILADSSGAGVPGASLTLTNQDTTAVVATEKSDSSGNFSFQAVPAPGAYTISVKVTGFARLEQKDIVVTAGERRSVGTLALAVGTATESVTPVQTESAERSGDLDKQEIGALLARGLNFNGLMRSLPGISGATDPNTPGEQYAPYGSINGTRWSETIPTMDGVMASDPSSQGQLDATEATDALSEVHIDTSNYQAEYGQSGGAIINLTTKAGTKQFHGDLYTRTTTSTISTMSKNRDTDTLLAAAASEDLSSSHSGKSSTLPKTGCSSSSTINTLTRVFLTRWWKTPCLRLWNAPVISLRASPWAEP